MAEDVMFQEALEAIRQGQRARARDLLTRLLRADQTNLDYWLWMSSVVDSRKEQVFCLQSVLKVDPNHNIARQGLILLGALPADASVIPVPPVRRKWTVEEQEVPKRRLWSNPYVRTAFYTLLSLIVIGLIALGVTSVSTAVKKTPVAAVFPTHTAGPSPTWTYTPTAINITPSPTRPTPTFAGPPPLWSRLSATYTPTPNYVQTPHPANEAYTVALRSIGRGDYPSALSNLQQAAQMSPDAPDILYFMGEVYRLQGNYEKALEYYEKALSVDPNFAPAYLGLARVKPVLDPKADILEDLQLAVDKDNNYGEAYLELASYWLKQGDTEKALELLKKAEALLPNSPLVYVYRAQIYLQMGEISAALEDAQHANQLDITMLPAYRMIGEAALQSGDYTQAQESLGTYVLYETGDALAWAMLGQALYETKNYSGTLEALNKALELDKELPEAYYWRGMVNLALDRGQKAVNDFYIAKRYDPSSFVLTIGFGRGLLQAGRLDEALDTFVYCERLAKTDTETAEAYYWRAMTLEAIGNQFSANQYWEKLLELPEEAVPLEWRETAFEHLGITPTPTITTTPTRTPKRTPTPTATKTTPTKKPSGTPTPTPTPSPTPTQKASPTPTLTPTPTPTPK